MVCFLLVYLKVTPWLWNRSGRRGEGAESPQPVDCFDVWVSATFRQALPFTFYLLSCWQVSESTTVAGIS